MSQNTHGKTVRLLTIPFTLVLSSQRNALVFESSPLRLRAVCLRCSQFSRNISQHFTATCHYRRFTVVIYLSSFLVGSETTEPCHLYRVKTCYKLCSFWRFVETQPVFLPRLHEHFADILNSQPMCTVQLLMIKGGLTLILSFTKAWFFCGFAVQISVASSIALFRSLKVLHTVHPKRRV